MIQKTPRYGRRGDYHAPEKWSRRIAGPAGIQLLGGRKAQDFGLVAFILPCGEQGRGVGDSADQG
jgi:hypothetical protein